MLTDVRKWERRGRTDNELAIALRCAAYFRRQKRQLLDMLETQRPLFEAAGMRWVDIALLSLDARLAVEDELGRAYAHGQARVALAMRGSFELRNPAAVAYAQRRGAELVTAIDATTRRETKALISSGLMEGRSYGAVAGDLRQLFDGYAGRRALTIAVTENTMAYSEGTMDTARALQDGGLTITKFWNAEPECCDECRARMDAGWIPLDEFFPGDADSPADSHPNCRCDVQTRLDDPEGADGARTAAEVLEPMGFVSA